MNAHLVTTQIQGDFDMQRCKKKNKKIKNYVDG
jgi:hypothetical protein